MAPFFKDLRKHLRVVHSLNSPAYNALKQRGSGSIARIMALINVEEDIKSSWKNTAGYVWEEEYNEDNCPAAVQGDMPQRFSICVETEKIVFKKFGETKIFSSSSDGAKLIHKVYLIHPFLNDRHKNAVFVSLNHSGSNISFILDQTKCPRHVMYACFFCGGFHFIDVWGIKHLWA